MLSSSTARLALGALALSALAACGGESEGRFAAGTEKYPLECLQHQDAMPDETYSGEEGSDTAAVFQMLEYYTANKAVRDFCDGKAATKADRAWAQTYVDLGAARANVAHLLG